jgi:hypothetical protein
MSKANQTNVKIDMQESAGGGAPKNFRNHPDIENFFRFIYENDLREEALEILDNVIVAKAAKKKK